MLGIVNFFKLSPLFHQVVRLYLDTACSFHFGVTLEFSLNTTRCSHRTAPYRFSLSESRDEFIPKAESEPISCPDDTYPDLSVHLK